MTVAEFDQISAKIKRNFQELDNSLVDNTAVAVWHQRSVSKKSNKVHCVLSLYLVAFCLPSEGGGLAASKAL